MQLSVHAEEAQANHAAADTLGKWLVEPGVRLVMLAAGNTPLELYRLIGTRKLHLSHLHLFALDEYVGVPRSEPRNCAHLIRQTAAEPWGIPANRFHSVSSEFSDAHSSILAHERRIIEMGNLDVLILGLGQNGHLGFNEPGSEATSRARVLDLEPISIEANRKWFGGRYAPDKGVTVGMSTILASRRILILAFGPHKREAVRAMVQGPQDPKCPASLLRGHPRVEVFLDRDAAAGLEPR